jgi:hypothetical protein
MSTSAHEIAAARLTRDPSLLPILAGKLTSRRPSARRPADSTVRLANPAEVRPDLLFGHGRRGPWDAVELQRRIDPAKARRWPLLVSILRDQRRAMGDLWVITPSARVAAWARSACDAEGPAGTEQTLRPVVLLVGAEQAEELLDEAHPELAFFAAWAMHDRKDAKAVRVVERALGVTERLPARLRHAQERDIMAVLSPPMERRLKEREMAAKRRQLSPIAEEILALRAERRARREDLKQALIWVLRTRGLRVSAPQQAKIRNCFDDPTLDRWLVRAMTASSLTEIFEEPHAPAPSTRRPRPSTPRRTPAARPRAARAS